MTPSDFISRMEAAQSIEEMASIYGEALKACPRKGGWSALNTAMVERTVRLAQRDVPAHSDSAELDRATDKARLDDQCQD
jgi:Fic family protein